MSPRKKNKLDRDDSTSRYFPIFSSDFKVDLAWWYRYEPKKGEKVLDLVADILDGEPFKGLGKPEPLKYSAF